MSAVCHRTRLKSRYVLSICVGLLLGFLLSFVAFPLITLGDPSSRLLLRADRALPDVTLVDYGSKDYEPRIHPLPPVENKSKSAATLRDDKTNKLIRPRYIADELGIREKILLAVLTENKHLNTFALFHNQTLAEHVNRLLFFIDGHADHVPDGMQVLAIFDQRKFLKPFYVFKYLAEKMLSLYDWFLLVPDNTFIRGFKVIERFVISSGRSAENLVE